jgi:formate dehydrogenase subunit gamma
VSLGTADRPAYAAELATAVIRSQANTPGPLLPVFHALVEAFGYVDPLAVPLIAAELNLSRADVHGVLTFYHDFKTTPPPAHEVRICRAEACQSVGGEALVSAAEARLGVPVGSTGGSVALTEVFCLGMCGLAPAAQVDGRVVARLDADLLSAILDEVGAS